MQSYLTLKEQPIAETPLLLFDCQLPDGTVERWSTHSVTVNSLRYSARLIQHNVFELQVAAEQGVDGIPKISFELANADSHFSEIERQTGWKGSRLSVQFVFFDLRNHTAASDAITLFKGVVNAPELITESRFRLSAVNRLALQRVVLPPVRIQRRCPWTFPANVSQRQEALMGGTEGAYSRFYKCGYSADVAGGVGNLQAGNAFQSCSYTRSDCTARGMFDRDSSGHDTARFGGEEYVPSSILVRSAGESGFHTSALTNNESRYNDFVPLVYGTAFMRPSIVFARNDGNLTRMEVVLGMGPIQGVLKVVVNGIEIPQGVSGQNMTGTGWFNVISTGQRQGAFNPDFTDKAGKALGDPYGSISYLSVVIPNRINDGQSTPSVEVLLQGLQIPLFDSAGQPQGTTFSNNPAWVILDLLRRSGWTLAEFDLSSFARAAAFCDETISAQDLNGNLMQIPRFSCNLVLKARRSAGDVIRGIRNSSRLFLSFGPTGLLKLTPENSIDKQQPSIPPGSNATSAINGGYPAYEFGDGSNGFGGILRGTDGGSSVRLSSRTAADAPNRYNVEFQDSLNDFQQDSYSVVNVDDVAAMGQEVTQTVNALGLPHYDQAARVLQLFLNKSIAGNTFIEFDTSVKSAGLTPGDIISITYAKEGLIRQLFRVQKVALNTNYRTSRITAQWHDDAWYSDLAARDVGDSTARRHGNYALTAPRPIGGTNLSPDGALSFGVTESFHQTPDGTSVLTAAVAFQAPNAVSKDAPGIPLVNLAPSIDAQGGTLSGPGLYYGVTCTNADGSESALSFIVSATQLQGQTNAVTLTQLSFPATASTFSVYRGINPTELAQIATGLSLSGTFTDSGFAQSTSLPPDMNFDHVVFYWRKELQPEATVTQVSESSVGNAILQMPINRYVGKLLRISQGIGAGQERLIVSNTNTVVFCSGPWSILPDTSSKFTISDASYQIGSKAKFSPISFSIPNEPGAVIQISGRSVNANDVECTYELCPLTRWTVGGGGPQLVDKDIPGTPTFAIDAPKTPGGTLILSGIGFESLENTETITAATLTLYYVDETESVPTSTLATTVGPSEGVLTVTSPFQDGLSGFVQVDSEVLAVVQMVGGSSLQVSRAQLGTGSMIHPAGATIVPLQAKAVVIPLLRGFYGSPASGNWSYPVSLPNVRVSCATLTLSNSQGESAPAFLPLTRQKNGGLRTLSGGQYSFQISGYLAVQTSAAPEIVVDAPRVVRDVYALVNGAPVGNTITVNLTLNGSPYCSLAIPDGSTSPTAALDGFGLPALKEQDRLGIDIASVGESVPGSDLTVILRV